ncbi:serine hydrolase domain-containing protein [Telluria aromaticivorans]|uniref:Beta-lactamase family protein n=1 Tax=Telluria aromaticivorans TaxID=2725995 RepID=A0A7Y2P120_9BURK|nr:serine hydrolase domain-containing protein [Telluria aromaticivorans]NNG24116.1 beta-lactamase family protein [Telluria aromaticivorans]
MRLALSILTCAVLFQSPASGSEGSAVPPPIDRHVRAAMAQAGVQGLALAVIDEGKVAYTASWGVRNAARQPLTLDTIMYGASLTKMVFAYTVMQLVEEGKLGLDEPIARYLPKPLPDYPDEPGYGPWSHLAGDERWRKLTPRILLTHSSGFANFAFVEPDGRLRFHFDPGARYAYSGEGLILLQFVLERGLGLRLGLEMQRRVFDRFGMANTSMMWRPDFAANLADGWSAEGKVEPHDERSRVRAAGSMDTTIKDMARFAAGFMRGDGLAPDKRAEMLRPQLPITTATQFPSLQPELPPAGRHPALGAALGVVGFSGPQGPGFFKGGHNDTTGNMLVCIERGRRCVVLLANDVRAERLFPGIVARVLGETGMPWTWEYGPQLQAEPAPATPAARP